MVRQRDIQKYCAFDALEGFISADAWTAVRLLGALAAGPAKLPEICRHAASPAPQTRALLDTLTRQGLVRGSNGGLFVLTSSAQAISITDIVTAVDGDIRRQGPQDELPEIEDILFRITSATAAILDNFSLAEAAEP
jgi:DNA-binding IscR family transcriptional regulator